ncbi:hypothetical protein DICSQDRAFT_155951 [Dichomitus squalens LYAD-421 SS1]|uniref:Beta-glucuronidase C-terminal domain-containing protein n=1 Tax=Dichomitus squalens (strain LYAD-421) TaxID=732165 RepID=R7SVK8_DICSQ|nr:uncharacterized protein DICSQDRAFT_155951 [Dichomitus squalens LYAD-421 SS1]EJF60214.1 hypothetical protein DICSQDRAFT_155951 [Dichomitus squalens LYAD-421 SS1]
MLYPFGLLCVVAQFFRLSYEMTVYNPGSTEQRTGMSGCDAPEATLGNIGCVSALNAYNNVRLQPPPLPNPMPATSFALTLPNQGQHMSGLSIPQRGDFYGFSIEMLVVEQVVPFLNFLATLADRANNVRIRIGGDIQELASLVDGLPHNAMIANVNSAINGFSNMSLLPPNRRVAGSDAGARLYTSGLLYLLANVSSLVNVKWFLGIPMNATAHFRLQIAGLADAVGYQRRPQNCTVQDYFDEFGVMVNGIHDDKQIKNANRLVAPSLSGTWKAEDLWESGYLDAYSTSIGVIGMEHYPDQNCAAEFPDGGFGPVKDPQAVFPNYLTHASGQQMVQLYLNTAGTAQQLGKEFMMFETNTASCGGFPGVSDSFASGLWAVDYGLQMAFSNFTGTLLHVGGQNVSYNSWTVGPVMYATLFVAEALGTSNTSRVVDLHANHGNETMHALARIAPVNFMNEQDGAGSYNVTISVGGDTVAEADATPPQVQVKFLLAPTVSEKDQITWANQTFGGRFAADGRLSGTEVIQTVSCDQAANSCVIIVPAPGAALVFLSSGAQASENPKVTHTYSTTAVTNPAATVTGGANGTKRTLDSLSTNWLSVLLGIVLYLW